MADQNSPSSANGLDRQAAAQPNLALQAVYLKDCSYEAPLGPRAETNTQPQINLDLSTTTNPIQGDLREVVLTVTVSAKQGDKTLFLVEVKQAGAFLMQNLSEEDMKRAVASICPSVLFPYARAMVSQLVSMGGFPQLLLPPVNFDALYLNAQAQTVQTQQPPSQSSSSSQPH
jgi:preprotein translocase subunit SecB